MPLGACTPVPLARLLASCIQRIATLGAVAVQRGPHDELVRVADSVYGLLYASWLEQTR